MNNDDSIGSVTHLLRQLQNGEATHAQQEIWERYFQRLAGFARTKLAAGVRRTADEEDAVRVCAQRGRPLGDKDWLESIVRRLTLESTMRPRGRPRVRSREGSPINEP